MAAEIRPAQPGEAAALGRMLGRAFAADPMAMLIEPDRHRRVERLGRSFELEARQIYLPQGESYVAGGGRAAALWAKPGAWQPPLWRQVVMAPPYLRIWGLRRLPAMVRMYAAAQRHHPRRPLHWFLAVLGVDPEHQGRGLGTALVRHALDRYDQEGTPAYLETTNPANPPFYQRFGFEIRDEFGLPGGLTAWTLWRDPR